MNPEEIKDVHETDSPVDEQIVEVDGEAAHRSRIVNVVLVALFITLPLIYFAFRSKDTLAKPAAVQAAAQTDVAALE